MAEFCKRCGSPLSPGVRFCTGCGEQRIVRPPYAIAPVHEKQPPWNTLAGGVIAALVLLTAGFWYYQRLPHVKNVVSAAPLTQQQTVERYYADLNERRFRDAFGLMSNSWRSQLSYGNWIKGFDSTISQRATVAPSGGGRYSVSLVAV